VRTAQGGFGSPLAMASGGAGEASRRAAATPPAELSASGDAMGGAPVPQRTTAARQLGLSSTGRTGRGTARRGCESPSPIGWRSWCTLTRRVSESESGVDCRDSKLLLSPQL
jgi:hypothetical protein